MKLPVSEAEVATLASAFHAAMNTVIEEVGTDFDINRLCKKPPKPGAKVFGKQINVVALAAATSRITATAELFGVDAQTLVSLAKFPQEAVHRHKILARIAESIGCMSSSLYPDTDDDYETDDVKADDRADGGHDNDEDDDDDEETNDDHETDGEDGDEADDDEIEFAAAHAPSKREGELKRLEAAVTESVETVCWAHDETERAMDNLEESFRALIKAKDAYRDQMRVTKL
ncbi:MAG TPA: hypothetical protein VK745_24490 [Polyangiaceae bacterium]|jgi:hypothetical protein|nr:hypothetical protein [Polyangiaceae bacterium]